jgi:AraC-like DNA-binding protein
MKNMRISDLKAGGKTGCCALEIAEKIERSIAYMVQHLDRPLQVAALAAKASISPSHYFVLFKRQTGHAPIDYFTHLRMQYACRLLDSTSSSVKEVAAALGYNDPFYFSRVFKSVSRIAPSQYRDMSKDCREALKNTVSLHASPAPASLPASDMKRQRSRSPERTGNNGHANFFHRNRGKNRSIFHSATAELCHNQ